VFLRVGYYLQYVEWVTLALLLVVSNRTEVAGVLYLHHDHSTIVVALPEVMADNDDMAFPSVVAPDDSCSNPNAAHSSNCFAGSMCNHRMKDCCVDIHTDTLEFDPVMMVLSDIQHHYERVFFGIEMKNTGRSTAEVGAIF
jgi:hypothetical protein